MIEIILGSMNIMLLGACFVGIYKIDRKEPVLQIVNPNFEYIEEMTEEALLQNVVAYDEKDGDLTDSVVVEKIVSDSYMKTVTISFGVSDSAGNVGKTTCTLYRDSNWENTQKEENGKTRTEQDFETMEEVFPSAGEAANTVRMQ